MENLILVVDDEKPIVDILKLNKIYPICDEIVELLLRYKEIYFFEETATRGGIGEMLGKLLLENGFKGVYKTFAIADEFVKALKYAFEKKSAPVVQTQNETVIYE